MYGLHYRHIEQGANNYPRDLISKLSGITIPENKRNYRKQKEHMKIISAIRDIGKT